MPKAKNDINYPIYFIVKTVEEWDRVNESTEKCSQKKFASKKNIRLRTFKSWLRRRQEGKLFMEASSDISASRTTTTTEVEANEKVIIDNWISANEDCKISDIVEYMKIETPSLLAGKSYFAKRAFAERLILQAKKRKDGYIEVKTNVVLCEPSLPINQRNTLCGCSKQCGINCTNFMKHIECDNTICSIKGNCKNRRIQNSSTVELKRIEVPKIGFGVAAVKDIKKATFICEYIGEVISKETLQARQNRSRDAYVMDLYDGRYVDGFQFGNMSRYFNHTCKPNMYAEEWTVMGLPRVALYSNKAVKKDKELTFNYGSGYPIENCACIKCKKP
jgi:hypothetical protein